MPVYTQVLRQAGATGRVTIGVTVDKFGKLANAFVRDGDSRLGEISLQALKRWRWKPYTINGETVAVVSTVIFEYKANTGEILINPREPS
jgi:protein TonB